MDFSLADTRMPASFAHTLYFGASMHQIQNFGRYQVIMEYDICRLEQPHRTHGQQLGVAWSGANQIHLALFRPGHLRPIARVSPGTISESFPKESPELAPRDCGYAGSCVFPSIDDDTSSKTSEQYLLIWALT
jgi:hypothetical protein